MKFSWQQLLQIFNDYEGTHESVEREVEDDSDLTPGISPEALYTSLEDLRMIQTHPLVSGTWVDLGAGIGKSILTYLHLHPERKAIGMEKSEARFRSGQEILAEVGISRNSLRHDDLLTAPIPDGDTYFLYFPTGLVLDRILAELEKKAFFRVIAIESHGDLLGRLDLEPGLKAIGEIPLSSPRHHPSARVYEKQILKTKKLELLYRTFTHDLMLIEEEGKSWIGDTFGAEWIGAEKFNLRNPPRTIEHTNVKEFFKTQDLSSLTLFLCELRRLGEVEVQTLVGTLVGEIRKIYLRPSFCLELSGGQTVKWDDIQAISLKGHRCYDSSSPSPFSLPVL